MKLSTLLLSSAALIVAGSAYAADLPAKKGAPAAKAATGCPAFGAGFFQIPGGDTCIKFSGSVYADLSASNGAGSIAGTYDLYFDVRSNTDAGTVRGFAGMSGGTLVDKAYVQFGGLSAGKQNFITKIYGVGANQGGAQYNNPSDSLIYSMAAGAATVSVGLANANSHSYDDDGDSSTDAVASSVTSQPDLAASVSMKAGAADVAIAAVSHTATDQSSLSTGNGYALLGKAGFEANGIGLTAFGGYASGATAYIYKTAGDDVNFMERENDVNVTGTGGGFQATYTMGPVTLGALYAQAALSNDAGDSMKNDQINVWAKYTVAKNLSVTPELLQSTTDDNGTKTTSNTVYVRIARDF